MEKYFPKYLNRKESISGKVNVGETIVFGHFQGGVKLKEDKVIEALKEMQMVSQMEVKYQTTDVRAFYVSSESYLCK